MKFSRSSLTLLLLFMPTLFSQPIQACGWWGDGESRSLREATAVRPGFTRGELLDADVNPELLIAEGDKYRLGTGVARDYLLAIYWYELAAERGYIGGQYNLARMYEHGLGVPQNYGRAARLYLLSAEKGEMHSQHHLGEMYLSGRGVAKDAAAGVAWLEKSAQQGHSELFPRLAQLYEQGIEVQPSAAASYKWWKLAQLAGITADKGKLERLRQTLSAGEIANIEQQLAELSSAVESTNGSRAH